MILLLETDQDHFTQIAESVILFKSEVDESVKFVFLIQFQKPPFPHPAILIIEEYPLYQALLKIGATFYPETDYRKEPSKANFMAQSSHMAYDKQEVVNDALEPFGYFYLREKWTESPSYST